MPNSLKILQVSAFFPLHGGGIEIVAARLSGELKSRGHVVSLMAGGPLEEFPGSGHAGVACFRARSFDPLERMTGLPMPIWGLGSLKELWRHVRAADIVHVHDYLYFPSLAAVCFAKCCRKPIVLTQHAWYIGESGSGRALLRRFLAGLNRTLGAWILSKCDRVVFVGRPVQQYFEGFTRFKRPSKLIPNGVDHQIYRPAPHIDRQDAKLRCLFVGRFVENKGVSLLRRCMDLPSITWTFVGWGPLTPRNWSADEAQAIAAVHEQLRAEEVVAHYQQADLLVLPSTGEGFPLVVQEALSCGTPVLISQEVSEALHAVDERCIKRVELRGSGGLERLRGKLEELALQKEMLRKSREAAVGFSMRWSWENCVKEYVLVYEDLFAE